MDLYGPPTEATSKTLQFLIILYCMYESVNVQDSFCGLIPLIYQYLDTINVDLETRALVQSYLQLVSKRASGLFLHQNDVHSHFKRRKVTKEITFPLSLSLSLSLNQESL